MNSVFILGAGASVHAGIPVMKDFLEVVEDIHRGSGKHWSEYSAFDLVVRGRQELAAVQSKARFDIRNLESVFAAFEVATIFGELGRLSGTDVQTLLPAIRRVIVITLEKRMEFEVSNGIIQPSHHYKMFATLMQALLAKGEVVSIITFNYDIGLDFALRAQKLFIDYCLVDAPSPDEPRIDLMKLHGSINWAECNECKRQILVHQVLDAVNDEEKRFRLEGGAPPKITLRVGERFATLEHCGVNSCGPDAVIVPPTADKGGAHELLRPVWRRAAQHLREADNVFVLGYSWPNGDQFFRQLYALGTVGPRLLRKFWVFNPDPGVRTRIASELLGQQALDRLGGEECDKPFNDAIVYIGEKAFDIRYQAVMNAAGQRRDSS